MLIIICGGVFDFGFIPLDFIRRAYLNDGVDEGVVIVVVVRLFDVTGSVFLKASIELYVVYLEEMMRLFLPVRKNLN